MIATVLDSNIFISAFLFNGKQRAILEYAIKGKYKINISDQILIEIETVLKRPKFKLTMNHISLFISEIKSLCEICYPAEKIINVCRDSKDHIILECAIESKSDYIITGDDDLLSLKKYKDVNIINSDTFLKIIEETAANT
jgi:putative PIN family toxin of toxin-antitoxin system